MMLTETRVDCGGKPIGWRLSVEFASPTAGCQATIFSVVLNVSLNLPSPIERCALVSFLANVICQRFALS